MKKKAFVVAVTLSLLFSGILVAVGGEAMGGDELEESMESEPDPTDLADSAWPCFGHDKRNTGRSSYDTSHVDGTEKWNYSMGGSSGSSPVIDSDGTIYICSGYTLHAVHPNGTLKWEHTQTETSSGISPALSSNGTIYMGWSDQLVALDSFGDEKWNYTTGDTISSSPIIGDDGTVYVGSANQLYAINPDGSLRWNYSAGGDISSTPTIGKDGKIYVGADGGELYAINQNGTKRWKYTTGNFGSTLPSIGDDGTIYIGSFDELYAVNSDGTMRWSYQSENLVESTPSFGSDGTIYMTFSSNQLYAFDSDGNLKWNYTAEGTLDSNPAIGADGTIYVGSRDQRLYAINPDGSLKWKFKTGDELGSSPAIGDSGRIYFGSFDLNLYAIGGSASAPRNLQAREGDGRVNLSWDPPAGTDESSITEYRIYRGASSGSLSYNDSVDGSTTSYTDIGLTNGQTYYYRVSAVISAGEGDKSSEVSATPSSEVTVPSAPQNLQASAGDGEVDLTWDPPADIDESSITKYKIYRGTSSGSLSNHDSVDGSTTSQTDTGLTNGQMYYYQVSAVNSAGEGDKSSEVSATPSSEVTVPLAPQNLQASAGDGEVDLTWDAPSDDGGSSITEYKIYRGTSSGSLTQYDTVDGSTTSSYDDTGLTNDQTYYYQVSAVNSEGESDLSAEVSAIPSAEDDQNGDGTDDGSDNETDSDGGGIPGFTTILLLLSAVIAVAISHKKKKR